MAQIPYPTGIKPLVKPIAKPAGNPADRNFFSGSAVPVAPKVTPTVSQVRPTGPTPTNNFFNYTPPAPAAPKDNFFRGSRASFNPYMEQEFAKANADPNPGLRLPQYIPPPMSPVGNTVAGGVADLTRIIPSVITSAAGPWASAAVAGGSEALAQWWEKEVGLRPEYSPEQLSGNTVLGSVFSNWGGKPVTTGVFPDLPTSETAARIGKYLVGNSPELIRKENIKKFYLNARAMTDYRLRNELTDLKQTILGGIRRGESVSELGKAKYDELYQQYVDWMKQSEGMRFDTMKAFSGSGKGIYSFPDIFKYSSSAPSYFAPITKTIGTIAENLRAELSFPLVVNKRLDDATRVINEGHFPNIFENAWGGIRQKGRRVHSEYERWDIFPDNYWDILGRLIPEQIALIPKLKALIKGAELAPDRFPVYGFYQNPNQLGQADTYGPIQMRMKDNVKMRPNTTYTSGDSLNQGQMPMPWSNQSNNAIAAATGDNGWAYIAQRGSDYARPPLRYPDLGTLEQGIENKYLYGPYNGYAEAQFFPRGLEDLQSVNINSQSIPLLSPNIERDLGNFQNLLTKKGIPYTMQGDYGDMVRRFHGK